MGSIGFRSSASVQSRSSASLFISYHSKQQTRHQSSWHPAKNPSLPCCADVAKMEIMLRSTIPFLVSFVCFHAFVLVLSAQSIDLPEITGVWEREVNTISVKSPNERVKKLALYGFDLHGVFDPVTDGADYQLELTPSGQRNLDVRLSRGGRDEIIYQTRIQASTPVESVARACDAVIEQITGDPGMLSGKLVFVSNRTGHRELFISDLFFQNIRRITNHASQTLSPHWSPDGKKIVYTSYFASGFPDLLQYEVASKQVTPLAQFEGTNTGGAYDPFGARMALILSPDEESELFVGNAQAKNLQRLTRNESLESSPSWSPRGNEIVFTSDRTGSPQLYRMNASGGDMERIPTNISRYCAEPDWNPLHKELIVFTAAKGGSFQLALHNTKKRETRWLTKGGGDNREPKWMNDGRHILFTQRTGSQHRLHIMDVNTGEIRKLHSESFGNAFEADFVYPE